LVQVNQYINLSPFQTRKALLLKPSSAYQLEKEDNKLVNFSDLPTITHERIKNFIVKGESNIESLLQKASHILHKTDHKKRGAKPNTNNNKRRNDHE
jgi:hypothetical protein